MKRIYGFVLAATLTIVGCTGASNSAEGGANNSAEGGASNSAEANRSVDGPFIEDFVLASPDGLLRVEVGVDGVGRARYRAIRTVDGVDVDVVEDSTLGLEVTLDGRPVSYAAGGVLNLSSDQELVTSAIDLPTGKARTGEIEARQMSLLYSMDPGRGSQFPPLTIDLWVSDTGFAFRYGLTPGADGQPSSARVEWERTSVAFPADARTWIQAHDAPGFVTPAYEALWGREAVAATPGRTTNGWTFPALFAADGSWSLLTESAPGLGDAGSHISNITENGEFFIDLPDRAEGNGTGDSRPTVELPWSSPWRIVINSDDVGDVVESDLVRHLSPGTDDDFSWVRPGRVSWSWWSDHGSPRDPEAIEPFIDLAAKMGWEYSLVDANWNEFGEERLEELVEYAAAQDVELFVWYNSGGPNNVVTEAPRDQMFDTDTRRAKFAWLADIGVAGVKVDFFHSDKPESIARYRGILQDAADAELLLNFHGTTVPRGWSREFPHLMTAEAVRGAEIYTFDSTYAAAAPRQNTVLPFTRNVVGSMDYTPVILGDTVQRFTTNGHELALAVVFESGLQHFVDTPDAYLGQPAEVIDLLSTVPVVWDETQLIAGMPESHAVIARRHGQTWWIGAISAEDEAIQVTIDPTDLFGDDLPNIDAEAVCDNPNWDGKPGRQATWNDPAQYALISEEIDGPLAVTLVENGGCLIRLDVG